MRIQPRSTPIESDNISSLELKASQIGMRVHELPYREQEQAYVKENMRRLQSNAPGMVNLISQNDFRTAFYKRQYATQTVVINYTPGQVIAYDRTGLPYILDVDTRTSGYEQSCVIIRKDVLFDSKVSADRMLKGLAALGNMNGHDLRNFREELSKGRHHIGLHGGRIEMEHVITYEELQRAGGVIYHAKTDMVVSILGFNETSMHPCSSEYIRTGITSIAHSDEMNDAGVVIRYVNPDEHATPLYIGFANKIFTLIPQTGFPHKSLELTTKAKRTTDSSVDSDTYIEFIYSARTESSMAPRDMSYTRLSVDEAIEKYGLFQSYGEALNAKASHEAVLRRQKELIESLMHDVKAQKASMLSDFEIERRSLNDKLREKAQELEDLKRSNAAEIERLKEKREAQSHQQKLGFESVKFAISISTLLIGLVPVIIKLKQTAKQ